MKDFVDFIRKQGIVGLAIAFIMGAAVTRVVQAIVADIINPIIGVFTGQLSGFKDLTVTVGSAQLLIGDLISVLIDFVIVAFVVFGLYEWLKLKKLDKKEEK
jgi:large conductance mechanosensitive channel